jgi:hypothetical protein
MVLLETKTGSVKDGITELYKNTHKWINKKKETKGVIKRRKSKRYRQCKDQKIPKG